MAEKQKIVFIQKDQCPICRNIADNTPIESMRMDLPNGIHVIDDPCGHDWRIRDGQVFLN